MAMMALSRRLLAVGTITIGLFIPVANAQTLLSLTQTISATQQCEIVGCCLDDCCSVGTSWDTNIQYCVSDPESIGFNGTHLADYEEGCMSRLCCGNDCCGEGTRYDANAQCCVPIDTSTIEVDFTEAARDNLVILESIHYEGDFPTIEVTATEEAKIYFFQGVDAFQNLGQARATCPPAPEGTTASSSNFASIPLNGVDTIIYVCLNRVLVGRCIHIYQSSLVRGDEVSLKMHM